MLCTLQTADIAGIRAFALHSKDDEARAFYEHFDFIPSLSDLAARASERIVAGIRALAVRAKDDEARAFYEHFDFIAPRPIPATCSACSKTFAPFSKPDCKGESRTSG